MLRTPKLYSLAFVYAGSKEKGGEGGMGVKSSLKFHLYPPPPSLLECYVNTPSEK